MRPQRAAIFEKLISRIVRTDDDCWEWHGHRNSLGYAEVCWGNRMWIGHRLAYTAVHGAFDPKLDVLHVCDNPPCCNPEHLWLGTMFDNMRDRVAKGRHYLAQKTHCLRGHPLSGDNLYLQPGTGKRICITCDKARKKTAKHIPRPENRTHCKNGHELVGDAIYTTPSGRIECKICRRAAALRWLRNRMAA